MRYHRLDNIRGITLISMITYHLIWDLVYLFGKNWEWFYSDISYIWQQSICWSFIFLSGFCWSLGKKPVKRGMEVFVCGALVSVVTLIVLREEKVLFGILTFLGSAMLVLAFLERYLKKANAKAGFIISVLLFVITREVNRGYLGFEGCLLVRLPLELYRNMFTTYLGFTKIGFTSSDYFSVFPWIFLYLAGYFCYRIMKETKKLEILIGRNIPGVGILGCYALPIYMVHQPVIYLTLQVLDKADII